MTRPHPDWLTGEPRKPDPEEEPPAGRLLVTIIVWIIIIGGIAYVFRGGF